MTNYLRNSEDRIAAIISGSDSRFYFEHQEVTDVSSFSGGIFENRIDINPFGIPLYVSLQDNLGAGQFVRQHSAQIESAAREFNINSDMLKSVIYTEMARGWYDDINPIGSNSILPGNLQEHWAQILPGANLNNTNDNIRVSAKLIYEIQSRLDEPHPEDVYALYNSMSHDRTYVNNETKNTPYFLLKVLEGKAWQYENWILPNLPDVPFIDPSDFCFLSGTMIDMWPQDPGLQPGIDGRYDEEQVRTKAWRKPIEAIRTGDLVLSYDRSGSLKPGRVSRTFQNRSRHILDFWGTGVTPGHVYLCGAGRFEGQHVPLIDILRDDGAIVRADGALIRAAINAPVGSLADQFVRTIVGPEKDGHITVMAKGRIRLGTRAILPDGRHQSLLESIVAMHGPVDETGRFANGTDIRSLLVHWPFGTSLPKPEDYVLKRSDITLEEIYAAGEWEQVRPQMPPSLGAGTSPPSSGGLQRQAAKPVPNVPPVFADHPDVPRFNRKQRKAAEAQRRKTARRDQSMLH